MRLAAGLSAALLLTACGAAEAPLTVDAYLAQCKALRGKPAQVAGYLGRCGGYDCGLYADPAGEAAMKRRIDAGRTQAGGSTLPPEPAWIGIGADAAGTFDRKAAPLQNRYVVITGRVDDESCDGHGGLDRSAGIVPTDIRAWTPSAGAPVNSN